MEKKLYTYRFNLYFNDILIDSTENEYLNYGDMPELKEVYSSSSYKDFMNENYAFNIRRKNFGTLIKVGDKWLKKKDIKTIKMIRVPKEVSLKISFDELAKRLPFDEFSECCIDRGLEIIKLKSN